MAEVTGSNPVSPTTFRTLMKPIQSLLALLLIPWASAALAISDEAWRQQAEAIVSNLKFESGEVRLLGTNAVVDVPWDFSFLDAADAERILVDIWGNPPGSRALGLLVPRGTDFLSSQSWAIVLQYLDDGFVSTDSLAGIQMDELLAEMQRRTRRSSLERERQGYPGLELVGWAASPRLAEGRQALVWAKEIANPADDSRTLNYNIRLLGRHGVLVLTAVAPRAQLDEVAGGMATALEHTRFVPGFQYADFDGSSDPLAHYDIAGLIAEQLDSGQDRLPIIVWGALAGVFLVVFVWLFRRLMSAGQAENGT